MLTRLHAMQALKVAKLCAYASRMHLHARRGSASTHHSAAAAHRTYYSTYSQTIFPLLFVSAGRWKQPFCPAHMH